MTRTEIQNKLTNLRTGHASVINFRAVWHIAAGSFRIEGESKDLDLAGAIEALAAGA